MSYLAELFYLLRDIVVAVVHVVIGRRRASYATRVDVRASRETIWRLLDTDDVTFEAAGLRVRLEPIDGLDEAYVGKLSLRGQPLPSLAYQKLKVEPYETHISRYLAEYSEAAGQVGEDDLITILLGDGPKGTTRVGVARELTHKKFSTRIMAPIGVRQAAWMIRGQAEKDGGTAPGKSGAGHQILMALLAFVSFAWIAGWVDAVILMAVIAVHEGGHALAMLHYRLGIAFVGFIPFLGGMAAPARPYASDWQHGIVALMGVGVSLPVALALFTLADVNESAVLANAAALFAVVNGANLLPLPGLDGGMVVRLLSHRIHPAFAHVVMWAMMAAFVALAVYLSSPWVWLAVAFGLLQLVMLSNAVLSDTRRPLGWGGAAGLLVLYLVLVVAYLALSVAAMNQARDLMRAGRAAAAPAALEVSQTPAK